VWNALQRRESRLKKIRAAQRALEERARESAQKAGKPPAEVQHLPRDPFANSAFHIL